VPLVVTLTAYSGATRRLPVSVTPGVVSSRSSHTPCVGSLFSWYPSHLACSHRDLLTCLCVGSLFFAVFITPGVVSSRSSHTPFVGSLFSRYPSRLAWPCCSYRGGGCSAGSQVESGRSVERDNMQLRSIVCSTTGYLHSSSSYHPHGVPIFPNRQQVTTPRTSFAKSK